MKVKGFLVNREAQIKVGREFGDEGVQFFSYGLRCYKRESDGRTGWEKESVGARLVVRD